MGTQEGSRNIKEEKVLITAWESRCRKSGGNQPHFLSLSLKSGKTQRCKKRFRPKKNQLLGGRPGKWRKELDPFVKEKKFHVLPSYTI
jgi:hypothetical protein